MTVDMSGAYKRVNESHYPGRIRETNLSRERADDQRHLAEFEEFVRKQKEKHAGKDAEEPQETEQETEQEKPPQNPQDVVELHTGEPQHPAEKPSASTKEDTPSDADGGHLDITI